MFQKRFSTSGRSEFGYFELIDIIPSLTSLAEQHSLSCLPFSFNYELSLKNFVQSPRSLICGCLLSGVFSRFTGATF
jgi:hypothetical protein